MNSSSKHSTQPKFDSGFASDGKSKGTAILLFSQGARSSALQKSILVDSASNEQLFELLISQTRKLAEQSGIPLVEVPEQRGESFGGRLKSAYQEVFDQGFDSVIALGDDCVGLRESDLLQAQSLLSRGQAAIGPSNDGGTWLLGLTRKQFKQLDLHALPWCTNGLLDALLHALESAGEMPKDLLERKSDLDEASDWIAAFQEADKSLRKELVKLFEQSSLAASPAKANSWSSTDRWSEQLLRAPPVGC
jgi:glycosyltransferase A (GT-A) superfamily protein (DUF2064 family)